MKTLSTRAISQANINPTTFKQHFHIPLPPIAVQHEIASFIRSWDTAIEKMERLIAAKINHNIDFKYKLLFGKVRLGRRITKGFIVKPWFSVPNDWRIVAIGSTAKEVSAKNKDYSGDIPVLSCTKYQGLVDSLKYFDKQIFSKNTSTYKIVEHGHFAYATNHIEEGSIGYQNLYPKGLVSPMYTVFKANQQRITDGYLYKLLKTETYRHIFQVNTSASVDRRGSLRWNGFAKLSIPLPSLDEQKEINDVLETAQKEIDLLNRKVELLRKQKRGLMRKLLTGEWRVKTAGEVS
jgi:type I restriction enzyme S subunit